MVPGLAKSIKAETWHIATEPDSGANGESRHKYFGANTLARRAMDAAILAHRLLRHAVGHASVEPTAMFSRTPRLDHPPAENAPSDLSELESALKELPLESRLAVMPAFDRVKQSTLRRRQILQLVQDALSQLRLDMKYLMFDLEATRRERDELRQKWEEG
jgi:hypothetical protein